MANPRKIRATCGVGGGLMSRARIAASRAARSPRGAEDGVLRDDGRLLKWMKGQPWPTARNWRYPCPTFRTCLGGPLDLVEILDEFEFPSLGYSVGGADPPGIPDFLGRTRGGEWVLFECKSDDHLDDAVRQLSEGLGEFGRLGRRVDRLGIALNRVQSNEDYFVTRGGSLLSHSGLMPGQDVIRLPHPHGMPIMVELRGR
jgi:hypothetical protein